jgi:hypothetical protein
MLCPALILKPMIENLASHDTILTLVVECQLEKRSCRQQDRFFGFLAHCGKALVDIYESRIDIACLGTVGTAFGL